METQPKNEGTRADEDDKSQSKQSPNQQQEMEENDVQRGLTGETDDEEDVGGDLAGNASGNTKP